MDGLSCDRCGKSLLVDEPVRYLMELRISAAYDPMELAGKDLEGDLREQISDLISDADPLSEKEMAESITADRRFDLCPPCSRSVLENPFGKGA